MVKHIVLFKVNDKTKIEEAKNLILNLKDKIPEIVNIEVGTDIGFDNTASDFCLTTTFNKKEDLELYATHPEHLKVIAFIKTIATERRAIDYEI